MQNTMVLEAAPWDTGPTVSGLASSHPHSPHCSGSQEAIAGCLPLDSLTSAPQWLPAVVGTGMGSEQTGEKEGVFVPQALSLPKTKMAAAIRLPSPAASPQGLGTALSPCSLG